MEGEALYMQESLFSEEPAKHPLKHAKLTLQHYLATLFFIYGDFLPVNLIIVVILKEKTLYHFQF